MEGSTEQLQLSPADNPMIRQLSAQRQGGRSTPQNWRDAIWAGCGRRRHRGPARHRSAQARRRRADPGRGLDDRRPSWRRAAARHQEDTGSNTGAWQFDQNELEAALTQTNLVAPDGSRPRACAP
jgi:hypothetical protein